MSEPKKTFNEREAAEILRAAARLQAGVRPTAEGGMTLEELQQVAAEAGIERQFVLAAASERLPGAAETQRRLLGAPQEYTLQQVASGDLSPRAVAEMSRILEERYGAALEVKHSPGFLSWVKKNELGRIDFRAQERSGRVEMSLKVHIDDGVTLTWGLTGFLMLMLGFPLWQALPAALALPTMLFACALLILGVHRACTGWYRQDRQKAMDLMASLTEAAQSPRDRVSPMRDLAEERPPLLEERA
jgi:hypothetical protein